MCVGAFFVESLEGISEEDAGRGIFKIANCSPAPRWCFNVSDQKYFKSKKFSDFLVISISVDLKLVI